METIEVAVHELAVARHSLANAKAEVAERMKVWQQEHQALLEEAEALKTRTQELEDKVRELALESDETHPHPAITVKVMRNASYDGDSALDWCIGHDMRALLKLDTKAYEKTLLAGTLTDMPGSIVERRQATIKTDLDEWL